MSNTKIHDHHAVEGHDGATQNGPAIDVFVGNSFSFLIHVPAAFAATVVAKVQCAQASAADPSVPDAATWADLTDGGGCDKGATGEVVQTTITSDDAGNVVEISPDFCGCDFIRLVYDAASTNLVAIGLFENLRHSE